MKINFPDISKTSLIPLWGRAIESMKGNPILSDRYSHLLFSYIKTENPDIFTSFYNILGEYSQLLYPIRALEFDKLTLNFIESETKYSNRDVIYQPVIINLGAGLDTGAYRILNDIEESENKYINNYLWFDIDFNFLLDFKKVFLPKKNQIHYIGSNVTQYGWINEIFRIIKRHNISNSSKIVKNYYLFLASGLLQYFSNDQITQFFQQINKFFPKSNILFDTISEEGIEPTNYLLHQISEESISVKWGISNENDLKKYIENPFEIKEKYPVFENINVNKEWLPQTKDNITKNLESSISQIFYLKFI